MSLRGTKQPPGHTRRLLRQRTARNDINWTFSIKVVKLQTRSIQPVFHQAAGKWRQGQADAFRPALNRESAQLSSRDVSGQGGFPGLQVTLLDEYDLR